jgi:hypothetical protein
MRAYWLRFIDWIDNLFFNEMGDDEYDPGGQYIEEERR